jgi:hypothetical protein
MRRIHCLVMIAALPQGDVYAECACGQRSYGDSEADAFEEHQLHKELSREQEG